MDTHKNASLTPKGREAMARSVIEGGLSKAAAAREFRKTPKTVAKWVERFRMEGVAGLRDRSSRPHSSPSQAVPAVCAAVEALRRQRHTGEQIAAEVGVSPATVSRILKRLGLNRLSALEPAEPVRRYERAAPGEIIHIDIKKLGKFSRIGHRDHGGSHRSVLSRQRSPTSLSRVRWPMEISFARHQFPPDIIRHAVWLYLRFTLSFRDVEDLLADRGLDVSYETIRRWVLKFGPLFARELRRRRPRPTPR
jgi:transposase